jgi:hypothetical protein
VANNDKIIIKQRVAFEATATTKLVSIYIYIPNFLKKRNQEARDYLEDVEVVQTLL